MSGAHSERGRRARGRRADFSDTITAPVVPVQPAPTHERVNGHTGRRPAVPAQQTPEAPQSTKVPMHATWTEAHRGRWLVQILLVLVILAGLGCLAMAVVTQARFWLVGLALTALVAVVVRGAMISSTPLVVRLDGSNLTVKRGNNTQIFDLTDTFHLVESVGLPSDSSWRLRLEAKDGRITELTRRQVDPEVMHSAVILFRSERKAEGTVGPSWWMFRD